jgi:hypothetical protein
LTLRQGGGIPRSCRIVIGRRTSQALIVSFDLFDATGALVAQLRDFRFQRVQMPSRKDRGITTLNLVAVPLAHTGQRAGGADLAPQDLLPPEPMDGQAQSDEALAQDLDRLAAAFARQALEDVDVEAFMAADDADGGSGIERMALFLCCSDLAERKSGSDPDPQSLWQELLARHPEALAELTALGRAGARLGARLRGTSDGPLQVGTAMLEHFHYASPTARPALDAVTTAVEGLVAKLPAYRNLRIVELGADGPLTRRLRARGKSPVSS